MKFWERTGSHAYVYQGGGQGGLRLLHATGEEGEVGVLRCDAPSAAGRILEVIYWHQGLRWRIDKIHVLNPHRRHQYLPEQRLLDRQNCRVLADATTGCVHSKPTWLKKWWNCDRMTKQNRMH